MPPALPPRQVRPIPRPNAHNRARNRAPREPLAAPPDPPSQPEDTLLPSIIRGLRAPAPSSQRPSTVRVLACDWQPASLVHPGPKRLALRSRTRARQTSGRSPKHQASDLGDLSRFALPGTTLEPRSDPPWSLVRPEDHRPRPQGHNPSISLCSFLRNRGTGHLGRSRD